MQISDEIMQILKIKFLPLDNNFRPVKSTFAPEITQMIFALWKYRKVIFAALGMSNNSEHDSSSHSRGSSVSRIQRPFHGTIKVIDY